MPRWFRLAVPAALAFLTTFSGMLTIPDADARLKLVTKPVRWLNKAEPRNLCATCGDDTLYACVDDSLAGVIGDTTAIVQIDDMIPPPWRPNLGGFVGNSGTLPLVGAGDTVQTVAVFTLVGDSAVSSLSSITLAVDAIDVLPTRSTPFVSSGVQLSSQASSGIGAGTNDWVSFPIIQKKDDETALTTNPSLSGGPFFHSNLRFRITATVGLPWCRVRGFISYYADVPE